MNITLHKRDFLPGEIVILGKKKYKAVESSNDNLRCSECSLDRMCYHLCNVDDALEQSFIDLVGHCSRENREDNISIHFEKDE